VIEGFEPMEVPRGKCGAWDEALREFLDSGHVCIGRRYGDAGELAKDRAKAYQAARKVGGVKVCKRGDMLLLVRRDAV